MKMNPVAEADPLPVKHQATKAITAVRRRFPKPHPQAATTVKIRSRRQNLNLNYQRSPRKA